MCPHLQSLVAALDRQGIELTFSGQAWSKATGVWRYYDSCFDLAATRHAFGLVACVEDHVHLGTHDGSESGFVCAACGDAVMGLHPQSTRSGSRLLLPAPGENVHRST
jgi:hypothetical protein